MESYSSFLVGYPPVRAWLGLLIAGVVALSALRAVGLVVYRLWFSPLAHFPGPSLAAATHWYEAYYDLASKGGGQWTFQIRRLHAQYGPIVRINPDELHIDDADYYDVVFCNSYPNRPIDKIEKFRYRFGVQDAVVQTASAEDHRRRRAAIAPCFSKARIRSRNDDLQAVVECISERLSTEYANSGKVINITDMWAAMASDIITELAFAKPTRYAEAEDFVSPFAQATAKMVRFAHLTTHFGILATVMNWVPDSILAALVPPFRPILDFRKEMGNQIQHILSGENKEIGETSHPTIFHDVMSADVVPEDLTLSRLQQEAMGVNGGAVETTSWALAVASFHILHNPSIKARLKAELAEAIPDPSDIPSWDLLEQLPYLSGVIMEGLRLGYGSVQRLPRVNRLAALEFRNWTIPPNTPVSMDAYHIHMNEEIFPEPMVFRPERWLGNPKGPNGLHPLSYYMVSFSRGARNCLGINLAWMELYVGLATVFRRHDLELFETTRTDVDFKFDMVRPMPDWGSKGVRVVVRQ
ncbi:putative cytochrome P450 [Rosellinia necatrix]|uniref:Putative cytochrome P450 n=1 Tax=Rosellinia necatrix TaxID=77044 RepID=A0A1W2TFP1_ROSNE|nr:putative cytochrome P450 [Rosellinia necatrix]